MEKVYAVFGVGGPAMTKGITDSVSINLSKASDESLEWAKVICARRTGNLVRDCASEFIKSGQKEIIMVVRVRKLIAGVTVDDHCKDDYYQAHCEITEIK